MNLRLLLYLAASSLLLYLTVWSLSKIREVDAQQTPTGPNSVNCINSRDYIYGSAASQTCKWVGQNETRREDLCRDAEVAASCPTSCGHCCENDDDYTFLANSKSRMCSWLKTERKKGKFCDLYKSGGKVQDACAEACGQCFGKITLAPSPPTNVPTTYSLPYAGI